jgi:glycosyltransferase involved in cell wall biosynthesis
VSDPENWLTKVAFVSGVAEALTVYGEQVVIYNIDFKGEIQKNKVHYLFPRYSRRQLLVPFSFARFVADLKPDVVLVHGLVFPWQVVMLRRAVGSAVKIICQHHAERPFKDFRGLIARRADREVGAYLFASKQQGEEWVRAAQISSMTKVHEVMGTSSIFFPQNKSSARSFLGIDSKRVYLWIGDLDKNKDPLLTANAFRKFHDTDNESVLYMIFQKQYLINELKIIADSCKNIKLVGAVDHPKLQHWFNSADFIISSSHYEGSGIAVCEGLSCGCIPILTNIPSFRMMTANGSYGLLYETGDEDGLVRQLEQSKSLDLKSESQKVLNFFKNELSFEANARKIADIVKAL